MLVLESGGLLRPIRAKAKSLTTEGALMAIVTERI